MRSTFCNTHSTIVRIFVSSLLAILATSAGAKDLKCSLSNPKYVQAESSAIFHIELLCGDGNAQPVKIPDGAHLLVGLTLYSVKPIEAGSEYAQLNDGVKAAPAGESAFDNTDQDAAHDYTIEQKPLIAGNQPRQVLRDWDIENSGDNGPLDFDVQKAVADHNTAKYTFDFKADPSAIDSYNSFLFAVWQEGDKVNCDPTGEYARSGCKEFGYVFGDSGVFPLDFYPGAVADGGDRVMWIVERFK